MRKICFDFRNGPLKCLFSLLLVVVIALMFATGCTRFLLRHSTLKLEGGNEGTEVGIYKIREDILHHKKTYIPIAKIRNGREIVLENDRYFLANECSGYSLDFTKNTVIKLTKVKLETQSEKPTLITQCIDPIDEHRSLWTDRSEFSFLPDEIRFFIGGLPIVNELKNEGPGSRPETILRLFPLAVSAMASTQVEDFFVSPEFPEGKENLGVVVSAKVGETLWLLPGKYSLEVNGSQRKISIEENSHTEVPLGLLRIESPPNFPISGKNIKSNDDVQPVFAYINESVLFNLNNDYYVFPGTYLVSIGGSDVKGLYSVEASKKTVVKTRGAKISMPICGDGKGGCKNPPKVTIHSDKSSYPLMTVEPDVPFLVFEKTAYQYGVEGARGLVRDLATSDDSFHNEVLARVNLIWEPKVAERKTRTELVRFESRGSSNFGKTLDMLFHKPETLYAPPGIYQITYNLVVSGLEPSKVRHDLVLRQNETFEFKIPIFSDKSESTNFRQKNGVSTSESTDEAEQKVPTKLVPIHK